MNDAIWNRGDLDLNENGYETRYTPLFMFLLTFWS